MVEAPTASRPDDRHAPRASSASVSSRAALASWTAFPARDRPGAAFAAAAVIAALAATTWLTTGTPAWGAFTAAVLFLALSRFFLPTRYRLDETGITASHVFAPRRLAWREVRRCGFDDQGGFLGRRQRRTWFDGFTGLTLLYPSAMPASERDAIERVVRERTGLSKAPVAGADTARPAP